MVVTSFDNLFCFVVVVVVVFILRVALFMKGSFPTRCEKVLKIHGRKWNKKTADNKTMATTQVSRDGESDWRGIAGCGKKKLNHGKDESAL